MSWSKMTNQKAAVQLLRRSLQKGRLAHAYLLVAENLNDAQRLARELAKVVNCEKTASSATGDEACDRCTSCEKIEAGNHPDVRWIRPEMKSRQIGIEQVRELEQPLYLAAGEGRMKVGVLVEADRLTVPAANAFLKTLEEPPADSLILLLSAEPQRLLETILSRCQRISLAAGEPSDLSLRQKEALNQLVRLLEAAPTLGVGPKYQFLAWLMAQLGELRVESAARVEANAQIERYKETSPEWAKDQEDALTAAAEAEYVRERALLLRTLSRWLRDVMLCAQGAPDSLLTFPAQQSRVKKLAAAASPATAQRRLEIFEELQEQLTRNVNETLGLEVALLKLGSAS